MAAPPPPPSSSLVGLPPPEWPPGLGDGSASAGELPAPLVRDWGPMDARVLALLEVVLALVLAVLLVLLLVVLAGAGDGVGEGDALNPDIVLQKEKGGASGETDDAKGQLRVGEAKYYPCGARRKTSGPAGRTVNTRDDHDGGGRRKEQSAD